MQLIGEYLRDEMTLKRFFKELSGLTSPISSVPGGILIRVMRILFFPFIFSTSTYMTTVDIYRWLVHLLIYSDKDPAHKLMNFLLENGVNDNDLEYGMFSKLIWEWRERER